MVILLYHGVRPAEDVTSPDVRAKHVPETAFRRQMMALKSRHVFVSLGDVVEMLKNGQALQRNGVCITFDDGYKNNATVAAPILNELGIPATFFLTTGFLDGTHPLWVDRFESAFSRLNRDAFADAAERQRLKRMPIAERDRIVNELETKAGGPLAYPLHAPMTWDDARALRKAGHEIGAHTISHPNLSQCTMEEAKREIVESKRRIEQEIGEPCKHFAHPNGQPSDWTEETLRLIRETGFESCSTTIGRLVRRNEDIFALPRLTIDGRLSDKKFALTVAGIWPMLQRMKAMLRPTV